MLDSFQAQDNLTGRSGLKDEKEGKRTKKRDGDHLLLTCVLPAAKPAGQ